MIATTTLTACQTLMVLPVSADKVMKATANSALVRPVQLSDDKSLMFTCRYGYWYDLM